MSDRLILQDFFEGIEMLGLLRAGIDDRDFAMSDDIDPRADKGERRSPGG
nr:hypothetical protein [Henriciella sp.]